MKATITLHDDCARIIIKEIAKTYATLCVKSKTPMEALGAPWRGRWESSGKSRVSAYRDWVADIDRRRADYRKSLQSVVPDLPPVPEIEMKPYRSPHEGKTYCGVYSHQQVAKLAEEYAAVILGMIARQPAVQA